MSWKERARNLKREVFALYFACRDPRVPWHVKALAAGVVAYAFSPIDLIPDFIPVIGLLDDFILVPLGVLAVRAMIPAEVLEECRERAAQMTAGAANWVAAGVIVTIWVALALALAYWMLST